MKILVLSLLRIGDIVLSAPVLRGLRERYPEAEIDLLINSQFSQVGPLLPYIDNVLTFDRERLQKGLGDPAVPIFDSYERLAELVDSLNASQYQLAINLTHNRLSGWLMGLLNAPARSGLCLDSHGRASFSSSWFRYLNQQVEFESSEVFHYADVFRFALELGDDVSQSHLHRSSMVETVKGRKETDELVRGWSSSSNSDSPPEIIAVQALTSDSKKDWGLERFAAAIQLAHRSHPNAVFALLGAPFEQERLLPLQNQLASAGVRAELAILSFEGAFSLLRRCKVLLTGDTSVKHLACAARTPVVEVCIGSSDPFRTGAYQHGSVIVRGIEYCAPCVHSQACHREEHFCAKRVAPELVAMLVGEVFDGRYFQLKTIADEFKGEAEILRVDNRTTGFWAAYAINEAFDERSVGRWIDLFCRKIWHDSFSAERQTNSLDQMGTEILRLGRFLSLVHPETTDEEWSKLLSSLERQVTAIESGINGLKIGVQYLRSGYEDPRRMKDFMRALISMRERTKASPLLASFKAGLDEVIEDDRSAAFTRFRRICDLVVEIERRTDIYLRLIRGLGQRSETERGLDRI